MPCQYKRCIKGFYVLGWRLKIKNEIFHACNEKQKEVHMSEILRKFKFNWDRWWNTKPRILFDGENSKGLSEYRYGIENSIKGMISNWSEINIRKELEYTYKGKDNYTDERGEISNYELTEPINLIGHIIKTNVGANHFHPIQEQKCLLLKGEYISITKDLLDEDSEIESLIIKEGDLLNKTNVTILCTTQESIFKSIREREYKIMNYPYYTLYLSWWKI